MRTLGTRGRFGNQLFQYAALKGIARNRGLDYCIPGPTDEDQVAPHELFAAFGLPGVATCDPARRSLFRRVKRVSERSYRFDGKLFDTCPDDVDLFGYFQSEQYFDHIRDEIIDEFALLRPSEDKVPSERYVAIHVRRGDYVAKQFAHPLCTAEYYAHAMAIFPDDTCFVVFSDDLDWCSAQDVFAECRFSVGTDMFEDMYLMAHADHNIVANSSFSWWGAWLNRNPEKIVVAPDTWFTPSYISREDTQDLYPASWLQLPI